MGFCTSQIPWIFNWQYRNLWVDIAIWPSIAHLSKQVHNISPLFSVVVGVGVVSVGNGDVESSVILFSVVVICSVGSAGNSAVNASAVNLSSD